MTACHHLDGAFWCDRRADHRKPHRFVVRPVADLYKLIFSVWDAVHPDSHWQMGWVIPAEVRQRLIDENKERLNLGPAFVCHPDEPSPPPVPDMLLGRPVRIGGRAILLEVVSR